ncbi:MAG: T9SS type A sorting domain-containing protein [Bacteroidota bacterium]
MKRKICFFSAICCALLFGMSHVIKAQGCYTATVTGQPITVNITTQPVTQNKCLGSSVTFSVTTTGDLPITYQWIKDGFIISGATNSSYTIPSVSLSNEGMYACQVSNLCRSITSDQAELKVIELNIDAGQDEICCNNDAVQLNTVSTSNYPSLSQPYTSISWSPATGLSATNISNPVAQLTTTTTYTVVLTDALGCTASDDVEVLVQNVYQDQQLCLVTVDPTVGKNKVMWEKVPDVGTESYLVQKEISTNIYSVIGVVPAVDTSYFIDYASVPESHGDKYKITVMDTCGNQSDLDSSFYHKTINLTIAAFGTTMGLNWDYYEVEDASFVPSKYYIYRGTTPFNLQLIDSVSGSFNSYNDNNITTVYYYMVGAVRDGCGGTKSTYSIFSNQKDNIGLVGVNSGIGYNLLSIYPNPFNESTTIQFSNPNHIPYTLYLHDITGKPVRESESITDEKIIINKNELSPGMYMIELVGEKNYKGKLIIK